MAKQTGNYTAEASRVIKRSDRLECQVAEDGAIYICNGFWIYKMTPSEYSALVQPVVCCEPGNWHMDSSGKKDRTVDVLDIFIRTVEAAKDAATMQACPMVFTTDKKVEITGCFGGAFAAMYNRSLLAAISPIAKLKATSSTSAALAYADGEPFAMVLPIKPVENICRAVTAYFTEPSKEAKPADHADQSLRTQLAAKEAELAQALSNLEALRAQIASQSVEMEALRDATQKARRDATSAETILERLISIPGITATVKGSQTATPVIWLSGKTEQHADALKSCGARWSAKRSAYYIRVA